MLEEMKRFVMYKTRQKHSDSEPYRQVHLRVLTMGTFTLQQNADGMWKEVVDKELSSRGPSLNFLKVLLCSGSLMDSHNRATRHGEWEVHEVSRDALIDALWPEEESAPLDPNRAVAVAKSVLNHALRPYVGGDMVLLTEGSDRVGYALNNRLVVIDADAFETAVWQASEAEGRGEETLSQWEAAYYLVQGEFLPRDQYNDWSTRRRKRLHAKYRLCVHRLAQGYTERGQTIKAVELLHPYVLAHPDDQDALCVLLPLLCQQGRYQEALQLSDAYQQALQDEGKEPSSAMITLVQSIRQAHEMVLGHLSRSVLSTPPKTLMGSSSMSRELEPCDSLNHR